MRTRKSVIYFVVLVIVAGWFLLIIKLSYQDDRLFQPMSYSTFKHAIPSEFDLYCQLNPRPGLPVPQPNAAVALVATLKNKMGNKIQTLLVPNEEFSCLRVQVFPLDATTPTYDRMMETAAESDPNHGAMDAMPGEETPAAAKAAAEARRTHLPTWHSLSMGPLQSIGKEIVLPQRTFPKAGDYKIVLHWHADDRTKLEGNVAPIDRDSVILDLQTEQIVRILPPGLNSTEPPKPAAETPTPRG